MTAAPTVESLGLATLPADQRLALAEQLWDTVVADLEAEPLTAAQRTELERRIVLADTDPARGTPWDEVRAAARARWRP